jgi:hypothetical protein
MDFFHVFFLTALAAWAALPLASFAVVQKQQGRCSCTSSSTTDRHALSSSAPHSDDAC